MAMFEIIATAVDNASGVLRGIGSTGGDAARTLATNWKQVAIAGAAAGAAVEGLARNVAPLNKSIRNLADSTDMTEQEVRSMTASLVNATFPAKEVTALLEEGRQQGLKSADQLKEFANFWDMVGDATGEASDQLAKSGVALRALGVETGNETQALAAFGFITQETSQDLGEFLRSVERLAPEMSEMGLNINDAAAIMGALESKGISGRAAMTQFRQAVNGADGNMTAMLSTLGISTEELAKYNAMVGESAGVIEQRAKREAESKTALQGLMAVVDRAKVSLGGYLETTANLAPALMALGPAIKAITIAKGAWIAIQTKLNIALLANPIGIIIALVAALAAGAFLLIKNWDTVGPWFGRLWEGIKDIFFKAWEFIKWLFLNTTPQGLIIKHWQPITGFFKNLWQGVTDTFRQAWEFIGRIVDRIRRAVGTVVSAGRAVGRVFRRGGGGDADNVPSFHSGGIFNAPTPGGAGLAMLRDREVITTPEKARSGVGGRQVVIDQRGLFDGANIRMASRGDAERLSEQLYALTRSRLRAEGVVI